MGLINLFPYGYEGPKGSPLRFKLSIVTIVVAIAFLTMSFIENVDDFFYQQVCEAVPIDKKFGECSCTGSRPDIYNADTIFLPVEGGKPIQWHKVDTFCTRDDPSNPIFQGAYFLEGMPTEASDLREKAKQALDLCDSFLSAEIVIGEFTANACSKGRQTQVPGLDACADCAIQADFELLMEDLKTSSPEQFDRFNRFTPAAKRERAKYLAKNARAQRRAHVSSQIPGSGSIFDATEKSFLKQFDDLGDIIGHRKTYDYDPSTLAGLSFADDLAYRWEHDDSCYNGGGSSAGATRGRTIGTNWDDLEGAPSQCQFAEVECGFGVCHLTGGFFNGFVAPELTGYPDIENIIPDVGLSIFPSSPNGDGVYTVDAAEASAAPGFPIFNEYQFSSAIEDVLRVRCCEERPRSVFGALSLAMGVLSGLFYTIVGMAAQVVDKVDPVPPEEEGGGGKPDKESVEMQASSATV